METFLDRRGLRRPDGRALYAYRCTSEEFASLADALSRNSSYASAAPDALVRAFVLYAAEWWQRRYDGRRWSWDPLLESVGWEGVYYPNLYEPVRQSWRWWKIDLVRLSASNRYLGTFACQGGLPLALVGRDNESVTRYLRAVLKHTAAYRQFVEDPVDLARDQQHLLRPPTLRRDYVFRLAADLVEAVLDLEPDARDEDPISSLDQAHPDWRRAMPLDLEDERARGLLMGLLREARRDRRSPADDFHVERFLRRTGVGWRIGARIRLPASIPADVLARRLGVSADVLPIRLQVCTVGKNVRVLGWYGSRSDDFLLASDARGATEIWDMEAAGEVRLRFRAGGVIGEPVSPRRGAALGELPWAFRIGDGDHEFIGEGSIANRSSEIRVLVPDGCALERGEPIASGSKPGAEAQVRVLGRALWGVSERTTIETEGGRCVINPSSGQPLDDEHWLSGRILHGLESAQPLFRGPPVLRFAEAERPARAVPAREVEWRQARGDWRPHPSGFGLWEVRRVRNGELRHWSRAGILPEGFECAIDPGRDMKQGCLMLTGGENVRVTGGDPEAVVAAGPDRDAVRVEVTAKDEIAPPVRVKLRLHWPGAAELAIVCPFPGRGARFLREGQPLNRELSVDELYGVQAVALSPDLDRKFWVEGALKAEDAGDLVGVARFRHPLAESVGTTREFPLIDLRAKIGLLLSASSSRDASVLLSIVDDYRRSYETARVSRFEAVLECPPDMSRVVMSPPMVKGLAPTFEAMPLARPGAEPVQLESIGPADAPNGAVLPRDLNVDEPWLVCVRQEGEVRVRPVRLTGHTDETCASSSSRGLGGSRLAEAVSVAEEEQRMEKIAAAMGAMLKSVDSESDEEEWSFLADSLLCAEGLPAPTLDICKVLATKPRLLVRSLFRFESTHRQRLWRLDEELPFSWLLIRRAVWRSEAKRAFNNLREQLIGVLDGDHDAVAREHIEKTLDEGAERLPALGAVCTDVAMQLTASRLNADFFREMRRNLKEQKNEQIQVRARLDDWPAGYDRREWVKELGEGVALGRLFDKLHGAGELRERQPILDTPVAAAWCCYFADPTDRTVFLVKNARVCDQGWFDAAYKSAWLELARMQDDASGDQR